MTAKQLPARGYRISRERVTIRTRRTVIASTCGAYSSKAPLPRRAYAQTTPTSPACETSCTGAPWVTDKPDIRSANSPTY